MIQADAVNEIVADCCCRPSRRKQLATTTTTTTRTTADVERSYNNYSIKLRTAADDVTDDVIDDDDADKIVQLSRSDQLGFGFSAAGDRPTTIRSVIKGMSLPAA